MESDLHSAYHSANFNFVIKRVIEGLKYSYILDVSFFPLESVV